MGQLAQPLKQGMLGLDQIQLPVIIEKYTFLRTYKGPIQVGSHYAGGEILPAGGHIVGGMGAAAHLLKLGR